MIHREAETMIHREAETVIHREAKEIKTRLKHKDRKNIFMKQKQRYMSFRANKKENMSFRALCLNQEKYILQLLCLYHPLFCLNL